MRLEDITVVVRPRGVAELFDLALLLIRRHPVRLLLAFAIGVAPCAGLTAWMLAGVAREGLHHWLLMLSVYALSGVMTAVLTAFLGLAMFAHRPTVRQALGMAWRSLPVLLLLVPWRLLCAVAVVILPWSLPHLCEVAVLERLGLGRAWSRAAAMQRVSMPRSFALVCADAIGLLLVGFAVQGLFDMGNLLRFGSHGWSDDTGYGMFALHVTLWCAAGFLGVVRFCAYIDLRIRHEGWDVELDLRRAGARLGSDA